MEEAVTFHNRSGRRLFGIVHLPEGPAPKEGRTGINLLNPGIKYRVAPNRLNVKLARELCRKGYYVLRFDPEGIGDSEGALPEDVSVPDIWEKIQTGLFVPDTIAANDYLVSTCGIEKLVLAGNCGGAITSLLASAQDERVNALCAIDVPVNLRQSNMSFADKVAEGGKKEDWLFTEYVKRALRPHSWYRFITLQTDYSALWTTLTRKARKTLTPFQGNGKLPENIESLCREKRLNKLFFEAFETMMQKKKPVLFVLAGNDAGTEIFQAYFQREYLAKRMAEGLNVGMVDVSVIEEANHIYTLTEWQKSLISTVSGWMGSVAGGDSWRSKDYHLHVSSGRRTS